MAKKHYLPRTTPLRQQFLANFADKLPGAYATKYNITAAEVTAVQNFRLWYDWCANSLGHIRDRSRSYTQFRDALAFGDGASGNLTPPQAFALPDQPESGGNPIVPVADGFALVGSLVTRIKSHLAYAVADGQDLGIEGTEEGIDPNLAKPVLNIVLQAGRPLVQWTKQGFDSIEIQVDRGNGFGFLAIDSEPDYLDTAPLPAPGQSAVWKYKAIYRLHDEQVGQWSYVVTVAVTG